MAPDTRQRLVVILQPSDYYVIMQLMRWQTQHDHRTRLLIEETKHVKKSRMKLDKEPYAAREPRVGHPCYIIKKLQSIKFNAVESFLRLMF